MFSRLVACWRQHFLGIELSLGVLVVACFSLWVFYLHGDVVIDAVVKGNRGLIYGTVASICGSLFGFVMATLGILVSAVQAPALELVRGSRHYETLWRVFLGAIRWLSLASGLALAGLIFDLDTAPSRWIMVAVFASVLISVLRLIRCIWVFESVIWLIVRPGTAPAAPSASPTPSS